MTPKTKKKIEQIQNDETPNGYKFTDVGILPNDWNYAKLSDISKQITQTAGTAKYETVSISAGIGFVNQAKKFGKELSGKQYAKYTVLHKGDFSYNKGNSKKYPQGCVYRLKDRETAAVPNVFESFRITTGCAEYYDQLFISGYLNHQLYRLINHGVRDDGLLNLIHKDFYSCLLPVPPLSEQEKIAKILSAQDKVIECYEKKIEQLRLMKKYYLQNMFSNRGETVPKIRFKGFTDAWEQRKLGKLAIFNPKAELPEIFEYVDLESVVGTEMISHRTESKITAPSRAQRLARTGDLFYQTVRPYQKNNYLFEKPDKHYVFSTGYAQMRPLVDGQFLLSLVQNENFVKMVLDNCTGTSYPAINSNDLADIEVLSPTEKEEQRIIGSFFKGIGNLITLHQRLCNEEKKKKKALQQLLLTGIVRTNE